MHRFAKVLLSTTAFMCSTLFAQSITSLPEIIVLGPLGLTVGQTARLSVLAPGLPAPFATGIRCSATLSILDSQGNAIKSEAVTVNPNQTLWLDVTDLDAAATSRVELSGRVSIPAIGTAGGYCTLVPTLEFFDTATGRTTAIAPNAFTVGGGRAVPANTR